MKRFGIYVLSFVVLLLAIIHSIVNRTKREWKDTDEDEWKVALRLYRGPFLIVIYLFLAGVTLYIWRIVGIDRIPVFELEPTQTHIGEDDMMEIAGISGIAVAISLLIFLHAELLGIARYTSPLVLPYFFIFFLINPTNTFWCGSRYWLLVVWGRILAPPILNIRPRFTDVWFTDQLSSLAPVLLDLEYLVCFCFVVTEDFPTERSDPFCRVIGQSVIIRLSIAAFPAWVRFTQCLKRYSITGEVFPHLVNAGKYVFNLFVTLLSTLNFYYKRDGGEPEDSMGPYFTPWLVLFIISCLFGFFWDLKMDWGLLSRQRRTGRDSIFLRDELLYPTELYYYVIIQNFFLRFAWALSWNITRTGFLHEDLVVTGLAFLEIIRLFFWNLIRLESEHIVIQQTRRR